MEQVMHKAPAMACRLLTSTLLLAATAIPIAAQDSPPAPDVAITARVTAREVVFHEQPRVNVTFVGPSENATVWETERENLPRPVQPRVIYRNIGVILTITSTLPDIDRIVDEALGLITPKEISDDTPDSAPDARSGGDAAARTAADHDQHVGRRP